jgi:hypothetical protein
MSLKFHTFDSRGLSVRFWSKSFFVKLICMLSGCQYTITYIVLLFGNRFCCVFHFLLVWQLTCSELLGFWTYSIVRYSRNYKIRRFGNWICFRPQVWGRGRDPTEWVSSRSCFLVPRIPDDRKIENPSNSECDTPSSEPFRTNLLVGP